MTEPLPDPLVVRRDAEGKEFLDPWGVQRDLEALAKNIAALTVAPTNLNPELAYLLGVSQIGHNRRDTTEVLTNQTTTSATFTDLATPHPLCIIEQPNPGLTMLWATVDTSVAAGGTSYSAIRVDGSFDQTFAVTTSASIITLVTLPGSQDGARPLSLVEGMGSWWVTNNSGTHSYQLKHASSGGVSATFANRRLRAIAYGW